MPVKIFSRMCTNQAYIFLAAMTAKESGDWSEYEKLDAEQNALMETYSWPWSANREQGQEWDQHLQNLEIGYAKT